MNKELEQCPICGFNDLNLYFICKKDYQEWVHAKVFPHKAKMFRVFAGHDGVLILTGSGKLYGMGNNNTGRFGNEKTDKELESPQLIAENVKSAALGYHYSIYLTKDGMVKLIGNSQIPYASRFLGFNNVTDVYASLYGDVFWLLLSDGSLYAWGDNTGGLIAPRTNKFVKNFQEVEVIIADVYERIAYRDEPVPGETSYSDSEYKGTNRSEVLSSTAAQLKLTDDFQKYAGQDKVNFDIEFDFINKSKKCVKDWWENHYMHSQEYIEQYKMGHTEKFQSKLMLTNRYIFNPESVSDIKMFCLPCILFCGSGLVLNPDYNQELTKAWNDTFAQAPSDLYGLTALTSFEKNVKTLSTKKIYCFKENYEYYLAVLEEDFCLKILHKEEIVSVIPNIADISIGTNEVYIVTKGGQIRRSNTRNLVNTFTEINLP